MSTDQAVAAPFPVPGMPAVPGLPGRSAPRGAPSPSTPSRSRPTPGFSHPALVAALPARAPRVGGAIAPKAAARPSSLVRFGGAIGVCAVAACAVMLAVLHLLPASDGLSPISKPLSAYALTPDGAIFDIAVLQLAAGMMVVALALILDGRLRPVVAVALATCITGLVGLVIFPDLTGAHGPTPLGWVHWSASVIAFGAMPLIPVRMWWRHRNGAGCRTIARASGIIGIAAYGWFALFLIGNIIAFATNIPLWRIGGLAERLLAVTELAGAAAVAIWAWRGCRCRAAHPAPRYGDPGHLATRG